MRNSDDRKSASPAKPTAQKPAESKRLPHSLSSKEVADGFRLFKLKPRKGEVEGWRRIVQETCDRIVAIQAAKWPTALHRQYAVGLAIVAGEFASEVIAPAFHRKMSGLVNDILNCVDIMDDPCECLILAEEIPVIEFPRLVAAKLSQERLSQILQDLADCTIWLDGLLEHLPKSKDAKEHAAFNKWLEQERSKRA